MYREKIVIRGVGLTKIFRSGFISKKEVVAVDNVDIEVGKGQTLALVGESGSGKSTLGKLLLHLIKPDRGAVYFEGINLTKLKSGKLRKMRKKMQLIPQHPEDALNPRWKIYDSIAEPLRIHRITATNEKEIVENLVGMVGLGYEHLTRYPHELSGGELQRAVIARAIATKPEFIVCDEPTSMLDVSIQASIVNLLLNLQHRFGITYLFITHDAELAKIIADEVAIMYSGQIIELGKDILNEPMHPYTSLLVNSFHYETVFTEDVTLNRTFNRAHPNNSSQGCKFYPLCPDKIGICSKKSPEIVRMNGRAVRCWLYQ
jgi:peptide/nickel transport system ATP-binding protein